MDTIFAPATARGKAGVAVIRVSGPAAHAAGRALAGTLPPPRQTGVRLLTEGAVVLDQALVVAFAGPDSFTGEDVVELHLHGSTAVMKAVLGALAARPGLRIAEPGEFTRRALENGRLELDEVEGLADLIDAETEAQRRQALRAFAGALGQKVGVWRVQLLRALALIEATIDFADEEVPVDVVPEVGQAIGLLLQALEAEAKGFRAAERLRDGFEVAIVGAPNVGKSTLLNFLAGREAAITSDIAGTTRDVIEVRMDVQGLPVTLLDTAGLRDSTDAVESIGIARTKARARDADLRIILVDGDGVPAGLVPGADDIVLRGKGDTGDDGDVSGLTGFGVDQLLGQIAQRLETRLAAAGVVAHERQQHCVLRAIQALEQARDALEVSGAELVAEQLRRASGALDALIGKLDVETVLGEIFARFCIGK